MKIRLQNKIYDWKCNWINFVIFESLCKVINNIICERIQSNENLALAQY